MQILTLLNRTDWTQDALADAVGVDQSTISRVAYRKRNASLQLALQIEAATEGKVKAEDVPMSRRARRALRDLRKRQGAKSAA